VTFNWGKLAGIDGHAQLLPLLAVLALAALLLRRRRLITRGTAAWCAACLAAIGAAPLVWLMTHHGGAQSGFAVHYLHESIWKNCSEVMRPFPPHSTLYRGYEAEPAIGTSWLNPFPGNFSAYYSADIDLPAARTYTFATESDDGSCLYIDGETVVNNWGAHGILRESGSRNLTAGKHRLEVRYENLGGGAMLRILWEENGEMKPIDPKYLTPVPK
jgi:hypothetical protein